MPRVNPCALKRPGALEEYREFTDPLQPGVVFGVALRAQPDSSSDYAATEQAQKYITDYVVGRNGGPTAPLPAIDGAPVVMSRQLCNIIAGLQAMEFVPNWEEIENIRWRPTPTEGNPHPALEPLQATGYTEVYAFDEWRAMTATAPNAWDDIVAFADELSKRAKGEVKN